MKQVISKFSTFLKIKKFREQFFFYGYLFWPHLRLTVKIFQFLRLSTKFLAILRLSVNPIKTLRLATFESAYEDSPKLSWSEGHLFLLNYLG